MARVGVFDIESDGTDHWGRSRDRFYRIGALSVNGKPSVVYDHAPDLRHALHECADVWVGHNIINFDLPALWGRDIDLLTLTKQRKIIDTMTLAPLQDPAPWSYVDYLGRTQTIANKPERMLPFYKLENLAHRYGFQGKVNDLRALAKERRAALSDEEWALLAKQNGTETIFGTIPKGDKGYREYLCGDIEASRKLAQVLIPGMNEYAWRELRVAAVGAQLHINGFRLDQDLAKAVIAAHTERNNRTLAQLAERYGVPLTDAKGRPRAKPLATKLGKEALAAAFRELMSTPEKPERFDEVWPCVKTGFAWGGEVIMQAAREHGNEEVQALAAQVAEIGGTRTVFKTALDNVRRDGFCHPDITFLQRTGRSSVTDPGLTVFGKHNGRHLERGIFVPDVLPGEDYEANTHVLFAVDLAQMDARAVAAHSQDHGYLDMFEPGKDSHTEGAVMIWGAKGTWGELDRRQHFKKLGHGWNYGMGVPKLAREAGVDATVAEYFDTTMRERFPRLVTWKYETKMLAQQQGWIDNGFGRRVMIDPERAHTQAPAGAGQSATRDILMQGALDVYDVDPRILLYLKAMVHDEFVFSVPRKYAIEVRDLVIKTLSGEWAPPGASRPVPVIADASPFATRWSGCYEKAG